MSTTRADIIEIQLDTVENLVRARMPGSLYQFELFDMETGVCSGRGALKEPTPWGSVYKLFVIAAVVQMVDEGILSHNEMLALDPGRYRYGEGILRQFSDLKSLSVVDCCKMVVATSDNVCADTLHGLAGNERVASLFSAAGCKSSRLTDNLDSLIGKLVAAPHAWNEPGYMYSQAMFDNYEEVISMVSMDNCTTVSDCNRLWRHLHDSAFSTAGRALFFEIARTHNVHSRLSRYVNYGPSLKMYGKTGAIGAGTVMNESCMLYAPETDQVRGYFSFSSQHNRSRFYELYDVLACVGLEVAKLYAQR